MAEDGESQNELTAVLNRENYQEIINELSATNSDSHPAQNALAVVQSHALIWEFANYRNKVEEKANLEQRQVTAEERDHGLQEHVKRMRDVTTEFQRIAQQGATDAKINFYVMLRVIEISNQSMPTWNDTIGDGISVKELSLEKQQLRNEVTSLLDLLKKKKKEAKKEVDLLIEDHYWPAMESELRNLIRNSAEIAAIEKLAKRLSETDGLDSFSNAFVANIILRIALAKEEEPSLRVLLHAEKAIQLGSTDVYPVLFDYYLSINDDAKAEKVLVDGSHVGQLDCIFKLSCRCFARNQYGKARDLFSEALSQRVTDSTIYLDMIYENAGDGIISGHDESD